MTLLHQQLTAEHWQELSFFEQMANIGAEVGRAINWSSKNHENSLKAAERALELLDLTLADPKNLGRLREVAKVREALVDYFWYANEYSTTGELWNSYFYPFNWAARLNR